MRNCCFNYGLRPRLPKVTCSQTGERNRLLCGNATRLLCTVVSSLQYTIRASWSHVPSNFLCPLAFFVFLLYYPWVERETARRLAFKNSNNLKLQSKCTLPELNFSRHWKHQTFARNQKQLQRWLMHCNFLVLPLVKNRRTNFIVLNSGKTVGSPQQQQRQSYRFNNLASKSKGLSQV